MIFGGFTIVMLLQILLFWAFHTYSGVLRYSSFVDTVRILFSIVVNIIVLIGVNLVFDFSVERFAGVLFRIGGLWYFCRFCFF